MLQDICLVDGEIVPAARIPVDDLAFTYGHGVYEHLAVRERMVAFLHAHVARLYASAAVIRVTIPYEQEEVRAWVRAFAARIQQQSFNLKLLAVGGRVYCFASNPHYLPEKAYRDGVPVITVAGERQFPNAKTLSMLTSYLAYMDAKEAGAYDALMVDRDGFIPEGTRTNIFYTDGERVYTPPLADVLPGVTRAHLLAALHDAGIRVEERKLRKEELDRFSLLLTSTSVGVVPVNAVDGRARPVPEIVQDIRRAFDAAAVPWERV